jgi:hypothetical protein
MRLRGHDALLAAVLYAAGLAARWPLVDAFPYGDEGIHWYNSRHWLEKVPDDVTDVYGATWWHAWWIGLQRPLWYILFMPAAEAGFEVWRMQVAILAAFLPVAGYGLARVWRASRVVSFASGATLASWPILVTYGGLGLMDELMAIFVITAIALFDRGHRRTSAVVWIAACWTKETAWISVGLFFLLAFVEEIRRGEGHPWPPRLGNASATLLVPLVVGPVPFILSLSEGLPFPGQGNAPYPGRIVDALVGTAWIWPFLLAGLRSASTRRIALIGSGMAVFYLAWNLGRREVMIWYYVLPISLAFVAVPVMLERWRIGREFRRLPLAAASLFLALVLAVTIVGPAGSVPDRALAPLSGQRVSSLADSYRWETKDRDRDLYEALDALPAGEGTTVLVLDAGYEVMLARLAGRGTSIVYGASWFILAYNQSIPELPRRIEESDGAVAQNGTSAIHAALSSAYGDCSRDVGRWWYIDPTDCQGRVERFMEAYENAAKA